MIQTGQPTVQYNDFKLSLSRKSGKKISWNGTNYKTAVCKLQYIEVKLLKYMPIIYYNNILYKQSTASIAKDSHYFSEIPIRNLSNSHVPSPHLDWQINVFKFTNVLGFLMESWVTPIAMTTSLVSNHF